MLSGQIRRNYQQPPLPSFSLQPPKIPCPRMNVIWHIMLMLSDLPLGYTTGDGFTISSGTMFRSQVHTGPETPQALSAGLRKMATKHQALVVRHLDRT